MAGTRSAGRTLDVTQGVIWRHLVALFLPVLAGALFQEGYTLANAYIVGQYATRTALGAIQATATLTDLTISVSMGVGVGCSVIVSQYFGAGDDRRLSEAIHTAIALSLVLGLACSVVGLLGAEPLLRLMNTPDKLLGESLDFVYVYFGAAALTIVFNMATALERAVGDTRTPALITAATCIINVALDLLFVARFGMGVRGAALATAGAYLVGCAAAIAALMRAPETMRLRPARIRITPPIARDMLSCAIPLAGQNAIFPLSNMVAQTAVNSFGAEVVISWGLSGRIGSVVWLVSDALAMAATTFSAQNFGAANYGRMRRGLHVSLGLAVVAMGSVEALICLNAPQLSALFTPDPMLAELTANLVVLTVPFYVIFSCMDIIAGVIRGTGDSLRPMLIIVFGTCVLRVAWMLWVVPRYHSILTVVVSYPITWLVTTLMFVIYYRHGTWLTRSLRTARRRRADV